MTALSTVITALAAAWHPRRDACLVLFASLILTGFAWGICNAQQRHLAALQFDALVKERVGGVNAELAAVAQLLKGAVAFVEADGRVDRRMWRSYADKLHVDDDFPAVFGLGYAPKVEPVDLMPMVAAVHADGFADFRVTPPGDRGAYFPVLYVEPFSGRNLKSFGYDMYADPPRRSVMDAARDSGQPKATGKTRLIEMGDQPIDDSFLLFVPVYETARLPLDLELRRHALRGFVYAPLRVSEIMRGFAQQTGRTPLDVAVYSGQAENVAALMYSSGKGGHSRFRRTVQLNVFGAPWTVVVSTNSAFDASVRNNFRWLLLAAGSLAGIILATLVHATENRVLGRPDRRQRANPLLP